MGIQVNSKLNLALLRFFRFHTDVTAFQRSTWHQMDHQRTGIYVTRACSTISYHWMLLTLTRWTFNVLKENNSGSAFHFERLTFVQLQRCLFLKQTLYINSGTKKKLLFLLIVFGQLNQLIQNNKTESSAWM